MPIDFPNSPSNGQTFTSGDKTWTYNGTAWVLSIGTVAIANAAIDVNKINGGTATNGYFLKVNTSANSGITWSAIPAINTLDDVGDVTLSNAASGEFLKYTGSAWVNDTIDLGTDTTGNYMSAVTAGTGVTVTHTPGEGSSATIAIGQAVGTTADVQFATVTTTGNGSIGGNLIVSGNLTVSGNTTTLNTETLLIEDNQIVLNSGHTGAPTTNAGIMVERGSSNDVEIRWNETTDKWQITNDGTTYSNIATASDVAGITITTLDDIGDVAVTGVTNGKVLQYNGSAWVGATITGGATIGDTAPVSPAVGQIWYRSDNGATYVYYDNYWVEVGGTSTNIVLNTFDAKGDLIVGTADNTISKLSVGTNGHVLAANSSTATGLEWKQIASDPLTSQAAAMFIMDIGA